MFEVSSLDCWKGLSQDENAILVDVRTQAELTFVGVPDLNSIGKNLIWVEWKRTEPSVFVEELSIAIDDKDRKIYFLCRSGQRSLLAAKAFNESTASSSAICFNVVDGFEGALDENQQRGKKSGWKVAGLPWKQS